MYFVCLNDKNQRVGKKCYVTNIQWLFRRYHHQDEIIFYNEKNKKVESLSDYRLKCQYLCMKCAIYPLNISLD